MNECEQHTNWRDHYRALSDLRRGVPVALVDGDKTLLLLASEVLSAENIAEIEGLSQIHPMILTSGERAGHLKIPFATQATTFTWPDWLDRDAIAALGDPTLDLSTPLKGPFSACTADISEETLSAALALLKQAQLLPTGIIATASFNTLGDQDILCLDPYEVLRFEEEEALQLRPVVNAKLPLMEAEDAQVFVFRPQDGSVEHLAIIIGNPLRDEPVLTRLHSECLTGDVLGSLKCDCGDQLRGAVRAIADKGCGILLYLAQEGRGIGLVNKLRAYNLQDQGYDTVDANLRLGFSIDERYFAPAALLLQKLGYSKVRLLTNNPDKVKALSQHGIDVVERVEHQFPANGHNELYLATKRDRTGHLL